MALPYMHLRMTNSCAVQIYLSLMRLIQNQSPLLEMRMLSFSYSETLETKSMRVLTEQISNRLPIMEP